MPRHTVGVLSAQYITVLQCLTKRQRCALTLLILKYQTTDRTYVHILTVRTYRHYRRTHTTESTDVESTNAQIQPTYRKYRLAGTTTVQTVPTHKSTNVQIVPTSCITFGPCRDEPQRCPAPCRPPAQQHQNQAQAE